MELETKITEIKPNSIITRGYDQKDLIKYVPFPDVIYLLLEGELPQPEKSLMVNALLIAASSIPPSKRSDMERVVDVFSDDVEPSFLIMQGLLKENTSGMIEFTAEHLQSIIKFSQQTKLAEEKAEELLEKLRKAISIIPPYFHSVGGASDICLALDQLARDTLDTTRHLELLKTLFGKLANPGFLRLPGFISAIGSDIGLDALKIKAITLIGRVLRLISEINFPELEIDYGDLIRQQKPFSHLIYEMLVNDRKNKPERARMLEAMIVAGIDHGKTPPSCQATIIAASVRADMSIAIANGISCINTLHGGAGGESAELMEKSCEFFKEISAQSEISRIEALKRAAAKMVKEGPKILKGWGHRIHDKSDPRQVALFSLAEELGFAENYVPLAMEITMALEEIRGKSLILNVDGAIGVIAKELGLKNELAMYAFILGRTAGLTAHYLEELNYRPMRNLLVEYNYTGPEKRELPSRYLKLS